jgi:hypothetical protein
MIDGSGSISLTRGSGSGTQEAQKHMDPIDPDSDPQHWYISRKMFVDPGSKFKPAIFFVLRSQTCFPLRYRTTARHLYSPTLPPSKRSVPPCDFLAAYTTSLIQEFVLFVCKKIDPSKALIRSQTLAPHDLLIPVHYGPPPSYLKKNIDPGRTRTCNLLIRSQTRCPLRHRTVFNCKKRSPLLCYRYPVPFQAIMKRDYPSWQDSNLQSSES